MKRFVCIKKFNDDFVIGKCYTVAKEFNNFYEINNEWFAPHNQIDFVPVMNDFFVSLSEYRKNKLNNINNKLLK